jgi:hypothetical protein
MKTYPRLMKMHEVFRGRLKVGQRTLDALIVVRVHSSEPMCKKTGDLREGSQVVKGGRL